MSAINRTLQLRPEPFDGVRVAGTTHVFLATVVDDFVLVAVAAAVIVNGQFVGIRIRRIRADEICATKRMSHARYIGDAVYASFDGYGIVLTTGSHLEVDADNRIALEPQVIEDLQRYIKDLKTQLEQDPFGKPEQI